MHLIESTTPPPTTGLRLGRGLWSFLLVPLVAESICFVGGLVVIYLARVGREYVAVGLLVAIFLFRLKSAAFTTAFAPLSDNTKIHVRIAVAGAIVCSAGVGVGLIVPAMVNLRECARSCSRAWIARRCMS